MATLSIQIRLGVSRGWRIRSLIKAKFYAQSVIHCLFIFSVLRARGFIHRMWTLHYAVFTNNTRYFIHVEYFRLPNTWYLLRKPQRQYLITYTRSRNNWPLRPWRESMWCVPHATKMKVFDSLFKRRPGRAQHHESLFWSWDRRSYLLSFMFARMRLQAKKAKLPTRVKKL